MQMQVTGETDYKCLQKKDLEIVIDCKMNMSQQCNVAVKKANEVLHCINQSISSNCWKAIVLVYWSDFTLSTPVLGIKVSDKCKNRIKQGQQR